MRCAVCGREVESKCSRQKYCSHECYNLARKVALKPQVPLEETTCQACGKKFTEHYKGEKFCSDECRFNYFSPEMIAALVKMFNVRCLK